MNLNSNPKVISLFTKFKEQFERTIEKDLYNRYSKNIDKLDKIIEHLEVNTIDVEDENIQIELNYFLEFLSNQGEEYQFSKDDQELITLKLVKLKLMILHKIKNNELDGLSGLEAKIKQLQAKKAINVSELEEIYGISKSTQVNYRGRLHDPLPYHQRVPGGKITYIVEEVEKWLQNQHK